MALFKPSERTFAESVSKLAYCNPFLPERVELERKALGSQFVEAPRAYSRRLEWELDHIHPNVAALAQRVEGLTKRLRRRLADGEEATESEVETWIDECPSLGRNYPWPGNVRELEQCVRNVMIRKEYHPVHAAVDDHADDPWPALAAATEQGTLTAEQLLQRYCTLVYARTGSYSEAARELNLDRRTIQRKIDQDHLKAAKRFWGTRKL